MKTWKGIKLSESQLTDIVLSFEPDNGDTKVDQLKIDMNGDIVALGYTCTDPDCDCVGGWWKDVAPYKDFNIINDNDPVLAEYKLPV